MNALFKCKRGLEAFERFIVCSCRFRIAALAAPVRTETARDLISRRSFHLFIAGVDLFIALYTVAAAAAAAASPSAEPVRALQSDPSLLLADVDGRIERFAYSRRPSNRATYPACSLCPPSSC